MASSLSTVSANAMDQHINLLFDELSLTGANGSPKLSRESTPAPITYQNLWVDQENVGGTTYFYAENAHQEEVNEDPGGPQVYPPYSIFNGPPAHLKEYLNRPVNMGPNPNPVVVPSNNQPSSFFVNDELKMEILHKNAVTLSQANPAVCVDLPVQVEHYHDVCPLESQILKSIVYGYPTSTYKAVNSKTGFSYCLKRIHGFRLPSGKWLNLVDAWKQVSHCNIVQLREVFTTKAFGDSSLIFVYDYFPASETLMVRHFNKCAQSNGYIDPFSAGDPAVPRPYSHQKNAFMRHHANMLPESLLWAYIIQISSVIRTVHSANLAVRSLDPTKILATSSTRPSIRVSCCGIYDIIAYDPSTSHQTMLPYHQQEDLLSFGKLILALACNSLLAIHRENISTSLDLISRTYSSDLRNLIMFLLNPRNGSHRSIHEVMPMIGGRFYAQLDAAIARAEFLEYELSKEIENGRLFRLLCKLCMVVDRKELNMDSQWSETGDRYLLKLYRDFVFHSVGSDGAPFLDLAHVIYNLNRLDAGISDKVMMVSPDEQNVLVTSYTELKHCLDTSFEEILYAMQNPKPRSTIQRHTHFGRPPY